MVVRDASDLAGGLRLTVDYMRGSASGVRSVVATLRAIPGVREVIADPRTGSVAVRYEPYRAGDVPVAPVASEPAPCDTLPAKRVAPAALTLTRIVETVVVVALEVVLQRVLGPFWPRRC